MTIKEFIGEKVIYDPMGQMILGVDANEGYQVLLDVRGWGSIHSNFIREGKSEKEAAIFQDEFGRWIADSINEKLKTT